MNSLLQLYCGIISRLDLFKPLTTNMGEATVRCALAWPWGGLELIPTSKCGVVHFWGEAYIIVRGDADMRIVASPASMLEEQPQISYTVNVFPLCLTVRLLEEPKSIILNSEAMGVGWALSSQPHPHSHSVSIYIYMYFSHTMHLQVQQFYT